MPALVERKDVITSRQIQADEIPGMSGLIAAVQQDDGLLIGLTPFEVVESLMAYDRIARVVANSVGKRDTEVVRAVLETRELVEDGHVQGLESCAEVIEMHARRRPDQRSG